MITKQRSVRVGAFFLCSFSLILLYYDWLMRGYTLAWFAGAYNLLITVEFGAVMLTGFSPLLYLFDRTGFLRTPLLMALKACCVLAAALFLYWTFQTAMRTHAHADYLLCGIQTIFLIALGAALTVNAMYYRGEGESRRLNLLHICGITYTVSVFLAGRLLQGDIIMPYQLLGISIVNIVISILAAVIMNPSEN